jgi:Protein of unknown function (DUF5672)
MANHSECRIVVPIYRSALTPDEEISLASIRKHLSGYGICFVAPESLDLSSVLKEGESVERFPDEFFSGIEGYNRLLKSSGFYERFRIFDYILIAQLDCLILRDELKAWMSRGWDYLAAPWFRGFAQDHRPGLWRVGNGGLSLRKVESFLRVLKQTITAGAIYPRWGHYSWTPPFEFLEADLYRKISALNALNPFSRQHSVEDELKRFPYNEDVFWGIEARKFDQSFKVADVSEGLNFAFEVSPRWCFKKTGRRLPFGCHAWARYDRDFWEEVLADQEKSV